MLEKTKQSQLSLSLYAALYDILIEKDNFWRILQESGDFQFIYDEVRAKYSEVMGRTAENSIRMFKYILLKQSKKLSDRDLIKHTRTDMLYKYFLGYDPEEVNLIKPSSLSKFRHLRLKDTNILDLLISKTVELALGAGLINAKAQSIQL